MATAAQLKAAEDALAKLKQDVLDKAMEIKADRGFCDDVDRFLAEVGIEPPEPDEIMVVVHIPASAARDFVEDNYDGDTDPAAIVQYLVDRFSAYGTVVESVDGYWVD